MKVAFIINPAAAGGKAYKDFQKLRPDLTSCFPTASFYFTEQKGHGQTLARQLAQQQWDRLIGVGGDGTFHEIINGLFINRQPIHPPLILGTLPMGSGSDLVKSLKIPSKPQLALKALQANHVLPCDLGLIQLRGLDGQTLERYFINLANLGLGASACLQANVAGKGFSGKLAYLKVAVQAIWREPAYSILWRSKKDQAAIPMSIHNISIANGQFCGGGMHMAPKAKLADGLLETIKVRSMSRPRLMANLAKAYWGGHTSHPLVEQEAVTFCEAHSLDGKPVLVEADGENLGTLPLKITCLPSCLRLNTGLALTL